VTRAQVLKAAREAFAEGGFQGTTLADISRRVSLTPAALLRHAPTKVALFRAALAEEAVAEAPLPMSFLSTVDAAADPAMVLRRLARAVVPFIEAKLGQNIAQFMHEKSASGATYRLHLPFDPRSRQTPPRRAFAMVEDYLRRAGAAGRIRVPDARAAALLLLGSLHSYVFLRRVLRVPEPPVPLDRYVDTLTAIWSRGAIRQRRAARRR